MKKEREWLILITMALLMMIPMLAASPARAGGVKVITSSSTPVDSIDQADVKKIFLGKTKSWPDGNPVEFVVLKSGDVHKNFLKSYVKKSASQFKTYWKKQVFTGKGKNPTSFGSENELLAYVTGKTGVIGYVSAETDTPGAKILSEQ
nr:substrate-binding domain-containing protein [uncultured Desulfobacter sp.]